MAEEAVQVQQLQCLSKQRCVVSTLVVCSFARAEFPYADQSSLTVRDAALMGLGCRSTGAAPPTWGLLGSGDYARVSVQNRYSFLPRCIRSSWLRLRQHHGIQRGKIWARRPMGVSWRPRSKLEGTFTIPVCDVSTAIDADYQDS